MSTATIYHIAHDRNRRGGGPSTTTGDPLDMQDSAAKLDQLVTGVHALEVTLGKVDGKLDRVVRDSEDHEKRLRDLEHRPNLEERMQAVEDRPRGVTAWQLWTAAGSAVAMAGVLVAIIDKLTN